MNGLTRIQEAGPQSPAQRLVFDGVKSYVEVPSAPAFSASTAGITIAVWMRPDTLTFPATEGSLPGEQYVHWLGKGERGHQEWTFRMYSRSDPPGPRGNRISFYAFNAAGGRGCGSYFQDPLEAHQWVHVVGVLDQTTRRTAIYKNGELRHSDSYAGTIKRMPGSAPLRLGTKDFASFFKGAIASIAIWDRPLAAKEIHELYTSNVVPPAGLAAKYDLFEGTGSLVKDAVHAYDGTAHDAAWESGRGDINDATGASGGGC